MVLLPGCKCCGGGGPCWRCYEFGGCDRDWVNHIVQTLGYNYFQPSCDDYYAVPLIVDCSYQTTSNNEGRVSGAGNPYRPISFNRQELPFVLFSYTGKTSGVFLWNYAPDPAHFGLDRPWPDYTCGIEPPGSFAWDYPYYWPVLSIQQGNPRDPSTYQIGLSVNLPNCQDPSRGWLSAGFGFNCDQISSGINFGSISSFGGSPANVEASTNTAQGKAVITTTGIIENPNNVTSWSTTEFPFDAPLNMQAKTTGCDLYESTFTIHSARLEDGTDIIPGGLGQ